MIDPAERPPALVLLHGFGSNEGDLMQIGEMLDERLTVVSLRAPHSMGFGAYAWFQIEWTAAGIAYDPAEAQRSVELVAAVLGEVERELGSPGQKLVLGGFSQGAMISLGVTLAAPELVAGLLFMSGRSVPEMFERARQEALTGMPVMVQHGTADEVLPVAGAREARDRLTACGAKVEYREYAMGHGVSQESVDDAVVWLRQFV